MNKGARLFPEKKDPLARGSMLLPEKEKGDADEISASLQAFIRSF